MTSWDKLWHKTISHLLFKSVLRQVELKNFVENKGNIDRRLTMEIYGIGEVIRQSIFDGQMIRDRKYHLRTYKSCFVGHEIIDWLVKSKHCTSRETAIEGLKVLQQHSFFHHVCDDHDIKDEALFYRFRRDDDTYIENKDLCLFYKAQELYEKLSTRKVGMMRSYQHNGELYRNAFQGSVFVDHLIKEGTFYSREDAMLFGRKLLENDTIRHVSDDYHFRDDNRLLYQFTLDFTKQRILADIFNFIPRNHGDRLPKMNRSMSVPFREPFTFHTPDSSPACRRRDRTRSGSPSISRSNSPNDVQPSMLGIEDRFRTLSEESGNSTESTDTSSTELGTTKSVLLRQASVAELESPDTPYIRTNVKIRSDPVGYGFVIRGESPTYVQAVDPTGPAAVAGLKVRQYIHSVNGQYVLRCDHKTVGKLIMRNSSSLNLVIMTHKRDAGM